MKSILISIRPQWVEKIASGQKTIEVRKTAPKEVPFKVYIYCCKAKSKWSLCDYEGAYANSQGEIVYAQQHIIGEFICDKVDEYNFHNGLAAFNSMGLPSGFYSSYLIFADDYESMCLSYDEVKNYGRGKTLYGWHISDLKIYDKPKELSEFCKYGAITYEDLSDTEEKCNYCTKTCNFDDCDHSLCDKAYQTYLYSKGFELTRPPQSWQYVGEVEQTI
jgi:hypothetical protein